MFSILKVLAFLACVGHGRRLQTAKEKLHRGNFVESRTPLNFVDGNAFLQSSKMACVGGALNLLHTCEMILPPFLPPAAFNPVGPRGCIPLEHPALKNLHPVSSSGWNHFQDRRADQALALLLASTAYASCAQQHTLAQLKPRASSIAMDDLEAAVGYGPDLESAVGYGVLALSILAVSLRPGAPLYNMLPRSEAAYARSQSLCRETGWEVKINLQRPKKRGIVTKLIFGEREKIGGQVLNLLLAFDRDERFNVPAGTVRLMRESRYVDSVGKWSFKDETGKDMIANSIALQLTSLGLEAGDISMPEGSKIFMVGNFKMDDAAARVSKLSGGDMNDDGLRLVDGRITVQLQPSQMGRTLGVGEFDEIGTFSASPARRNVEAA